MLSAMSVHCATVASSRCNSTYGFDFAISHGCCPVSIQWQSKQSWMDENVVGEDDRMVPKDQWSRLDQSLAGLRMVVKMPSSLSRVISHEADANRKSVHLVSVVTGGRSASSGKHAVSWSRAVTVKQSHWPMLKVSIRRPASHRVTT